MNLIVDAGNSRTKLAVFQKGSLLFCESGATSNLSERAEKVFEGFPGIGRAIISSVGHLDKKGIGAISGRCGAHLLGPGSKLPFTNRYTTPETLGADRMALATSAHCSFPKRNVLVIDAGTCLTFDLVNDRGEYLGGAISPGVAMRYGAMHRQTSALPLLEKRDIADFIGNSTGASIHSGAVNGISNEIDGTIDQYCERFTDLTVILTGGDAQFLSKRLKNTIFANSIFLLEGLNYLLEYNKR